MEPGRKLPPFTTLVTEGRGGLTVKVTLITAVPVRPLVPVTVMVPVCWPTLSPDGLTETVSVGEHCGDGKIPQSGKLPVVGETESQLTVSLAGTAAAAVNPVLAAPETDTVCAAGAGPPER